MIGKRVEITQTSKHLQLCLVFCRHPLSGGRGRGERDREEEVEGEREKGSLKVVRW